jgi:hypothetical protein
MEFNDLRRQYSMGVKGDRMKKCEGCMYWSEMLAQSTDSGHVAAMCLNESSPRHQKYSVMGCDFKANGTPVDFPCEYCKAHPMSPHMAGCPNQDQ